MSLKVSARSKVFIACGGRCHYCGDPATTVDHIVPRSVGGPSSRWNLTAACRACNSLKGSLRAVCSCHGCIEAERTFEGYSKPSNVRIRRPRTDRPRRPVIAPVPGSDGPCPITVDGQHVLGSGNVADYCVRCFEVLAA